MGSTPRAVPVIRLSRLLGNEFELRPLIRVLSRSGDCDASLRRDVDAGAVEPVPDDGGTGGRSRMGEAVSGCAETCCAVFYLSLTPEELAGRKLRVEDIDFIADMVIPLAPDVAKARADRFDMSWPALNIGDEYVDHVYTCRHWDEATRLCTVYERRPRMCRDYPYDGACGHCGFRESEERVAGWRRRWSRKTGGYRPREAAPAADWELGEGWMWDGQTLVPSWPDGAWDHRTRRWRVKA